MPQIVQIDISDQVIWVYGLVSKREREDQKVLFIKRTVDDNDWWASPYEGIAYNDGV